MEPMEIRLHEQRQSALFGAAVATRSKPSLNLKLKAMACAIRWGSQNRAIRTPVAIALGNLIRRARVRMNLC